MSAKPGPKPKPGERYDSGRLKPESSRSAANPSLDVRKAVIERQATDSKWGSALGLLYLEEHLTREEMRAGFAYGRLRANHDVVMGLPRRSTQAMCYHEARASTPRDMDPEALETLRTRHSHMLGFAGGARMLLDQVCCDDRPPAAGDILRLAVALRRIVQWFGMEQS